MLVLEKFDDVVLLIKNKTSVSIDLEKLDYLDYLKAVSFIHRFKGDFKKLSRFKYVFNYN